MRKLLVLISLLFVTVCYAAPPPEPVPVAADEVAFVADQEQEVVTDFVFAQEVAFTYIGNAEIVVGTSLFYEPETVLAFAELPVIYTPRELSELRKPPSFESNAGVIINYSSVLKDKQNTNYG